MSSKDDVATAIWLHDDPSANYHDTRCRCARHCGYCFEALGDDYGPRVRYCSAYCKGRAARERDLDRRLSAGTAPR